MIRRPSISEIRKYGRRILDDQRGQFIIRPTVGGGGGVPDGEGNVFNSGWDEDGGAGCGLNPLLDGTAPANYLWDDFGPSGTCVEVPVIAQAQTGTIHSGVRALQVHFKIGDGSNGPDFRIISTFGPLSLSYYRAWMRWDANWLWSPGQDHKTMIWGPPPELQYVYFNLRGRPGGTAAYVDCYSTLADTHMTDPTSVVPRGEWVLMEMGVQWGPGGWVRIWVNDVQANLNTNEGGAGFNPENVNLGDSCGFCKLDTTYNNFAFFEANVSGGQSNCYYDSIAIDSVEQIGA